MSKVHHWSGRPIMLKNIYNFFNLLIPADNLKAVAKPFRFLYFYIVKKNVYYTLLY